MTSPWLPRQVIGLASAGFALRILGLAAKALLVFAIGRDLPAAQLGLYGLMAAAIGLTTYALSVEFSAFSSRELVAAAPDQRGRMIRDQIVFHASAYLLVLPLSTLAFAMRLLPLDLAGWFYAILFFEHASLESSRILSALFRPLASQIVSFVRSAAWVWVLLPWWLSHHTPIRLSAVWLAWLVGAAASLVLAAAFMRGLRWPTALWQAIDWSWIRRGAAASLLFFASALALRFVEVGGRFFLQRFRGASDVGVFTMYYQLASIIQSCVATFELVTYPKLVAAYVSGDEGPFNNLMRQFTATAVLTSVVLAVVIGAVGYPFFLSFRGGDYSHHLGALWILLACTVVDATATTAYYRLYVRRHDTAILRAALGGLIVSLVANPLLVSRWGIEGAAAAHLIASLFVLVMTAYAAMSPARGTPPSARPPTAQ